MTSRRGAKPVLIPSIRSKSQNLMASNPFGSLQLVLIPSIRSKSQNIDRLAANIEAKPGRLNPFYQV